MNADNLALFHLMNADDDRCPFRLTVYKIRKRLRYYPLVYVWLKGGKILIRSSDMEVERANLVGVYRNSLEAERFKEDVTKAFSVSEQDANLEKEAAEACINIYMSFHVSETREMHEGIKRAWFMGQSLHTNR